MTIRSDNNALKFKLGVKGRFSILRDRSITNIDGLIAGTFRHYIVWDSHLNKGAAQLADYASFSKVEADKLITALNKCIDNFSDADMKVKQSDLENFVREHNYVNI